MIKIYGVVLLYNPEETIIDNIMSYINYVEKLYIVDNSEKKNAKLINAIQSLSPKCIYIDNNGNQGVAHALNIGAKLAIKNGADWLLTMDQDSSFTQNSFVKLIDWIEHNDIYDVGIVSPLHFESQVSLLDTNKNYITMTSGNLVNLIIYNKVGDFLEELFIDSIDTEYCLRLKKFNYKIQRVLSVVLNHNLGDIKYYNFGNKKITYTNHNYLRRYYMMRNRMYIWKKYVDVLPSFINSDKKEVMKEIVKIILFEKSKFKKLIYIFKGYIDYKKNKFGKINAK